MKKRVTYIEQMEHSECGLACIAMILSYYQHHTSLSELRDEFGVPKGGGSFFHLSMIAQKKGMKARGFRCNAASLNRFPFPLVVHWDQKHFVVLERVKKNQYYIVDPEVGKRKLSLKEFEHFYSGAALSFERTESFEEKKRKNDISFFINAVKQQKASILFLIYPFFNAAADCYWDPAVNKMGDGRGSVNGAKITFNHFRLFIN